ncbi:GIY-YIG nuclease family protein [Aerococcaceae bacterium WGS1372]
MVRNKAHYFYVLYCQDNTLYGGYTVDLAKRLKTHNEGKGAKYTRVKSRQPLRMIYAECFNSKSLAMSQEAKFKRLSRPAKEAYLKKNGQSNIQSHHIVIVNRVDEALQEEEYRHDSTT